MASHLNTNYLRQHKKNYIKSPFRNVVKSTLAMERFRFKIMTSGGNSFSDFPEIVPTREITTSIERTFLVSSSVGLFLEWT